jgi:hypothetical protein
MPLSTRLTLLRSAFKALRRRLERETQRNVELMWLTGRLMPDFMSDNGTAIRSVCRQLILICQRLDLFADGEVAIDGSKFKAVNNRDKNFTNHKLKARIEQLEESIARTWKNLTGQIGSRLWSICPW